MGYQTFLTSDMKLKVRNGMELESYYIWLQLWRYKISSRCSRVVKAHTHHAPTRPHTLT